MDMDIEKETIISVAFRQACSIINNLFRSLFSPFSLTQTYITLYYFVEHCATETSEYMKLLSIYMIYDQIVLESLDNKKYK